MKVFQIMRVVPSPLGSCSDLVDRFFPSVFEVSVDERHGCIRFYRVNQMKHRLYTVKAYMYKIDESHR